MMAAKKLLDCPGARPLHIIYAAKQLKSPKIFGYWPDDRLGMWDANNLPREVKLDGDQTVTFV
jgi:hypothetical protein